jgi:hypothetical protein
VRALADRLGLLLAPGYFEFVGQDASQSCDRGGTNYGNDDDDYGASGDGVGNSGDDAGNSTVEYTQFHPFPTPPDDIATQRALRKLDAMASVVDLEQPWAHANQYLDSLTLLQWLLTEVTTLTTHTTLT